MNSQYELTLKKKFKHASIYSVAKKPEILIVEALSSYIPLDEFKAVFMAVGDIVKSTPTKKLIFDKRSLSVFHQPSMEWYFTDWKEEMALYGLTIHRKILPNNEVFVQSVKIGREKIKTNYPNGKFHELDISYANSIDEAIEN